MLAGKKKKMTETDVDEAAEEELSGTERAEMMDKIKLKKAAKVANKTKSIQTFPSGEVKPTAADQKLSGYNGAEEDEIMDKVIKKFSNFSLDSAGQKTRQLMLARKAARRVSEIILEATHKLKHDEVPEWIESNFEDAWNHFDQNAEGWLRYEECHTFLRYLMGSLNKF